MKEFLSMNGGRIVGMFKEAVSEWVDDKAPRLGASLAYYTLLSVAPLLVVAVATAALVFGKAAVEGQLFWETQNMLGKEGALAVQTLVRGADHPGSGIVSTIIGLIILLFGASSVVLELTDALNTIWHVQSPPIPSNAGLLLTMFKQRVWSFALILGTGFLLLVSLLINTVIAAIGAFFNSILPVPEVVLAISEFVVAFVITTVLFAAIYKMLPSVPLRWSDVIVGACVTSLLFTVGKHVIGLYLGKAGFSSTYGAAGSVMALLIWVYYSAQLFFLGAEFTKVYTRRLGSQRGATT